MKLKEKYFSAEEVSGGRDLSDKVYSAEEVTLMGDLFNEYYDEHYSFYEDNEELAYEDFYDAYSSIVAVPDAEDVASEEELKKNSANAAGKTAGKKVFSKNVTRGIATVAGAGVGLGATELMLKKLKKRRQEIAAKYNNGTASKSDIAELDKINKKIKIYRAAGTVIGGATGFGGTLVAAKYMKK